MKKTVKKKIWLGEHLCRYTTIYQSDPVQTDTEKRLALFSTLQHFTDSPQLLNCGPALMDKMNVKFEAGCWEVTLTVEVEEERPLDDDDDEA